MLVVAARKMFVQRDILPGVKLFQPAIVVAVVPNVFDVVMVIVGFCRCAEFQLLAYVPK